MRRDNRNIAGFTALLCSCITAFDWFLISSKQIHKLSKHCTISVERSNSIVLLEVWNCFFEIQYYNVKLQNQLTQSSLLIFKLLSLITLSIDTLIILTGISVASTRTVFQLNLVLTASKFNGIRQDADEFYNIYKSEILRKLAEKKHRIFEKTKQTPPHTT